MEEQARKGGKRWKDLKKTMDMLEKVVQVVCVRGGEGGGLEAGHCEVARIVTLGTARPPGAHSPTSGCEQCPRAAAAARPLVRK